MNKTAIKNFAIWARNKLISEITYKASLVGISEKGISAPLPTSTDNIQFFDIGTGKPTEIANEEVKQRAALVSRIKEKEKTSDYKTAFQFVMEEVAYTWFNRLVAIRFMEVNDYLPSRVRVLSSEMSGKAEPDMVTTPFDTDMEFNAYETDRIMQLKDENKLDELFRMLFIKQCNKLNEVLPELFEKTSDYTEYLLNISFTDKDGIVSHLVHDIEEKDFTEAVEIIGWLYQYYNTEPKEQVFANLKKNIKITKDNIPAATQLFTPDWIVRYMVENSLGRLWVEGHENDSLKAKWNYYLDEAEQEENVKAELEKIRADYKNVKLEEIKLIDPCMGSGHILVYAFDVLMQIYESQGYTERDAAKSIVEHNLYGLDIDERAYQLAYFAVMMKARQYDRRFLGRGIEPHIYSIIDCNNIKNELLDKMGAGFTIDNKAKAKQQTIELIETMGLGSEVGSLLEIKDFDWELLYLFSGNWSQNLQLTFDEMELPETSKKLFRLIEIAYTLYQKYDVVVTNPPYMGNKGMNAQLSDYVQKNYPDSKSDLFAVFIERCLQMTKPNGYTAMITQHAFMFLSSYEKLRGKLLHTDFINMAHLGARAFEEIGGEVVQTTSFVIRKSHTKDYKGTYARLVDYNSQHEKENAFLTKNDLHTATQENFSKIPGSPIAYWVSEKIVGAFSNISLYEHSVSPSQNVTGDNGRFVRKHWELDNRKIRDKDSWIFYAKGGGYRKWWGNLDDVVNWTPQAREIYQYGDGKHASQIINREYWYKKGITWGLITSVLPSFRVMPEGATYDKGGSTIIVDDSVYNFSLGLLNTKIYKTIASMFNPTLNFQVKDVRSMPLILESEDVISNLVNENIYLSKTDWDSFETSWDFERHPLLQSICESERETVVVKYNENGMYADTDIEIYISIENAFNAWKNKCETRFNTLKSNEEELNRIFIEIYGLQDELTPEVEDKDVTVRKADLTRDIKSFISYAVGCMLGRYSLDVDGLAYAGGDWDGSKYKTFIPDTDNVIPITDEEYFADDIVGLFVAFVKKVYGEETLEENLDFIAKALGNKGNTAREVIRNYFVKDFYKDHVKTYQKRPIYWLYDSGKADGFKALVYMHRYNADTTGKVRVDYLHKMQRTYMSEIERMQDMIDNSQNPREVAQAEKRKEKLVKQLKETKDYDEKIAHLALSRIAIDLDDGVKVNYDKVQTAQDGKKLDILGKI